jgi:hypothetical protein
MTTTRGTKANCTRGEGRTPLGSTTNATRARNASFLGKKRFVSCPCEAFLTRVALVVAVTLLGPRLNSLAFIRIKTVYGWA